MFPSADELRPRFLACSVDELTAAAAYLGMHLIDARDYALAYCAKWPSLSETRLCQDAA
jgi:hypothetical protein